jgi:hypothetical protein
MNDQPDPDLDELASALLDGDADAVAHARADDPAVRARVAEFDRARQLLRDVEPPTAAAREGALSAAMTAFDGTGRVAAPPPPSRSAVRTRWILGAAAAVVVAAVAGVLVGGRLGGSDEDQLSIDDAARVASTEVASATSAATESAAGADAATAEADAAAPSAAGGAADATSPATEQSEETTMALAAPIDLVGPDALAAYAGSAPAAADTALTACATSTLGVPVGPATYAPDAATPPVEVLVVRDDADDVARALDPASCEVVAEAPIP